MNAIKNTLLFLGIYFLLNTMAWAMYEESNIDYFIPTQEIKLEHDINGNEVKFSWTKAEDEQFRYYKLVYSYDNDELIYPDDGHLHYSDKTSENYKTTEYKQWYWRVCAVFRGFYEEYEKEQYRKCSNVIYLDAKEKTYEEKKDYNEYEPKKIVQKHTYVELSDTKKKKLDIILVKFSKNLESSNYDNTKIIEKIDWIIESLVNISYKKQSLQPITSYLIKKLNDIKEKFDDPISEIEWLFDF